MNYKGCLMLFPTIGERWKTVLESVSALASEHLKELEFNPHTTVLYGLDADAVVPQEIGTFLQDYWSQVPLDISLGQITHFECPEYDVLKFDVIDHNDNLHICNNMLRSKFPYRNDYPDYHPHVTLAYVAKGEGARLAEELNQIWSNDDLLYWHSPIVKYSLSHVTQGEWHLLQRLNYVRMDDHFFTNPYTVDALSLIQKAHTDEQKEEVYEVLLAEFQRLVLQGLIMFGYVYTDNDENKERGRVGKFSGFRKGTQYLRHIPDNKRPRSRSSEPTCLRYYDFGRMNWRSFKKDNFVVATSFYDQRDGKWKDNPYDAGFQSEWVKIAKLNNGFRFKDRPDTAEEAKLRKQIAAKEKERREREINKTSKKG